MSYEQIKRPKYNETGSQAHDNRHHFIDFENFVIPLECMHNSNLHDCGIARGLEVSSTEDRTKIIVYPGVAVENISGQLISLSSKGQGAIDDPDSKAGSQKTVTVPVPVFLSTEKNAGQIVYVTIESLDSSSSSLGNITILEQTPWIRLQRMADYEKSPIAVTRSQAKFSSASSNLVTVTPAEDASKFKIGDYVLLVQEQNNERVKIKQINGANVTFEKDLHNTYKDKEGSIRIADLIPQQKVIRLDEITHIKSGTCIVITQNNMAEVRIIDSVNSSNKSITLTEGLVNTYFMKDFDDAVNIQVVDKSIVLAIAVIDADGKIRQLVGNSSEFDGIFNPLPKYHRHLIGEEIGELRIKRSIGGAQHILSGKIGTRDEGGLKISVPNSNYSILFTKEWGDFSNLTGVDTPATLEVDGNIKVSGQIIQSDWTPPELQNDWAEYNKEYNLPDNLKWNPPGYFLDTNGTVHLRGVVKKKHKGTDAFIFNLPAGCRPAYRELHIVFSSENSISRCEITPDGDVIILSEEGEIFSLDGVNFKVTKPEFPIPVDPKPASAGSALTSAVFARKRSVYYFGDDKHVYELAHDGDSNWVAEDLTKDAKPLEKGAGQTPEAAAGSALTAVANGNESSVLYLGIDNHIYELAHKNGSLVWKDLTTDAKNDEINEPVPEASAGSALTAVANDNESSVLYLGIDNHIYELAHKNGSLVWYDLMKGARSLESGAGQTSKAVAGSGLASAVVAGKKRVYYLGDNGDNNHVYVLEHDGSIWSSRDLTPKENVPRYALPEMRSVLTTVVIKSGLSVLYFSSNHIYELAHRDDGVVWKDLTKDAIHFQTKMRPAPSAANGSPLTSIALDKKNSNVYYIYYLGIDNHIYELTHKDDGVLWRDFTADVTGPLAQLASGSALTSFIVEETNIHCLYCLGSNNHIYELAYDGSKWGYKDLTKDAKWSTS